MNKLAVYSGAYMNFPYTLPPLDYAYNALEPYVDEQDLAKTLIQLSRTLP